MEFTVFGQSEEGNYRVIDTIGVPHPYCITGRHVAYAADHHNGLLSEGAIESAETRGIRCGVRGCQLNFADHKKALVIGCDIDEIEEGCINPESELAKYLAKIKDLSTEYGCAGFVFMRTN